MVSFRKANFIWIIFIVIFAGISGCGGGSSTSDDLILTPDEEEEEGEGGSDSGGDNGGGDTELLEFRVFEGASLQFENELIADTFNWQQISGPTIVVSDSTSAQPQVTIPWIEDGPITAEFELTLSVDGNNQTQNVNVTITDRRYFLYRVDDAAAGLSNLYLRYSAEDEQQGSPDINTIQLTDVRADEAICASSISPTGRYVAFSIRSYTMTLSSGCDGLYLVDVLDQQIRDLSTQGVNNELIKTSVPQWSPDETQLLYRADVGFGADFQQFYVTNIESGLTSYINYDFNTLAEATWPNEDLYPYPNMNQLDDLIDNPLGFIDQLWLGNSEGLVFTVSDNETFDRSPYIASNHGDARQLLRYPWPLIDYFQFPTLSIGESCENLVQECNVGAQGLSVDIIPPADRQFYNARQMASSVDGYFAMIADVRVIDADSEAMMDTLQVNNVLSVREPVEDGVNVAQYTPIEALEVTDIGWSPVENSLAFTSADSLAHRHDSDDAVNDFFVITVTEGQLYIFQNYSIDNGFQEQLSVPVDIDDNNVATFEWDSAGEQILYARGEAGDEGNFFSSLWVVQVNGALSESQSSITSNTSLIDNPDSSNGEYIVDYEWAENGTGLVYVLVDVSGSPSMTSLWYANADGSGKQLLYTREGFLTDRNVFGSWRLSPTGNYVVYRNTQNNALVAQPTDGGQSSTIGLPENDSAFISSSFQWAVQPDTLVYSFGETGASDQTYRLINLNDTNNETDLEMFFSVTERISSVQIK